VKCRTGGRLRIAQAGPVLGKLESNSIPHELNKRSPQLTSTRLAGRRARFPPRLFSLAIGMRASRSALSTIGGLGMLPFGCFAVLGFADQEGYCNPSAATIGKALVIARPTVSEHIDKLICGQLIASPARIREFFAVLANGGDAGETHGDGPAGEMTTDGVVELSRGRRRPDR
jgi:hypothetical protein